ncbi:diacylglycerol kinase [Xylocopilactobacillus apicola]|uniref:Diacylglycerol kinase n=1 Tax=Xylocopilactobacillus apicola TaxID=2932184 RepID=A0AAU9D809_9LACO|nr:diacylglycerol kinase [Xylocopilactobacillus apicola]BDR58460.1 diacylglycerol kinase [Xylocopilactobacillus apicola]
MRKRARLIYNPTSGTEAVKRNIVEILNTLELAGYETSAFQTTPEPLSAQKEARRAALDNFDAIIAAGGDGTIHEVVNGISPLKHRPAMGIIPAGTTNDYARALKLPRNDPVAAAKVIAEGRIIKMDIGQANDRYFVNIAGGGVLTELTYHVPSEIKSIFGYFAYVVKAAEMLPQIRQIPLKLTYDDGEFDGKASMFLLGLTNSIGGFEQIAPDAKLGDGKFSLIVVKTANWGDIIRLASLVLAGGKHTEDEQIIYVKTKKLTVESTESEDVPINLDGELGGKCPMEFTNLKHHLRMFANLQDISDGSIGRGALASKEIDNIEA